MNTCPVCKNGILKKGTATVVLERGETLLIFKKVPADVCDNCGAYFLDEKTSEDLFKRASEAANKGAELRNPETYCIGSAVARQLPSC